MEQQITQDIKNSNYDGMFAHMFATLTGGVFLTGFAIHITILTSTLLRLLSFQIIKLVHEPEEATVGEVVRVLRSMRGLNVANGFNHLLHPFVVIEKEKSG